MIELLVVGGLFALFASSGKSPKKGKKERLVGGRADGRKSSEFSKRELKRGTLHELEHTKSRRVAQEIAMDHLAEHPDYYQKLDAAERKMKRV